MPSPTASSYFTPITCYNWTRKPHMYALRTFPFKLAPYTTQKLLGINKWIFLRIKLVLIYSRIRFSLASVLSSRQGPARFQVMKEWRPWDLKFATRCLQALCLNAGLRNKKCSQTSFRHNLLLASWTESWKACLLIGSLYKSQEQQTIFKRPVVRTFIQGKISV